MFSSTPSLARAGLTNSRISACGTAVAATLRLSAWAEKAARAANAAISFFIVKLLVGCVRSPAGNRYSAILCAPWGTLFSGKVHHQLVADGLQNLYQHQQEDHRHRHHVRLITLITVTYGQVAEAAAANQAAHGGVGHQGNCRHGDGGDDAGQRLGQDRKSVV